MGAEVRLLVTDLDGTLIGGAAEVPLYETFKERLDAMRRAYGTKWVACTGRTRQSFVEFFTPMRSMGLMPDYVIIRHAYILHRAGAGYVPSIFWNAHIFQLVLQQQMAARRALDRWREMITGATVGVRMVDRDVDELRLQFDAEESAAAAGAMLRDKLAAYPHLKVFTRLREVDVRPVPFTKGLAVSELARHLELAPARLLAIGNGHNDISMFDPRVAALTACPGNSEAEVMEIVSRAGGHVARGRCLAGVIEALDAYERGTVDSTLPEGWTPPALVQRPTRRHRRRSMRRKRQIQRAGVLLFAGVLYVVLVVFARFGLLPFGGFLLKPYEWLGALVQRVLSLFY